MAYLSVDEGVVPKSVADGDVVYHDLVVKQCDAVGEGVIGVKEINKAAGII